MSISHSQWASGGENINVLTLALTDVYFDQIAAGTKPEEYLLATPYWRKRLAEFNTARDKALKDLK